MNTKNILRIILIVFGIAFLGIPGASAQEAALRVGQSFMIRVTGVPQDDQMSLSHDYTIGDDGLIRLQYIEAVKASGLKPSELAKVIEQHYKSAEIYTKPTVNVSASGQTIDPTSYVSVLGEVKLPQTVPFRPGMTMVDAIAACGGFTDFAKPRKVKLVSGGQPRVMDLSSLSSAAAMTKLKVGDSINVPD